VLAALLLAGVEGSRTLQSAKEDLDPSYIVMCLDTTTNATVYQGFKGRCARGGGLKVCERKGNWGVVKEKCTAWDLAMVTDNPDAAVVQFRHLVGPQAGPEIYTEGYAELCLLQDRNTPVHQGSVHNCQGGKGKKLCGRYGRWEGILGTCTADELAITMKDKYGQPTKATGG
jgi:hypothetical protein